MPELVFRKTIGIVPEMVMTVADREFGFKGIFRC
jgi:hypothetical protein